jgi:hypothetical protein
MNGINIGGLPNTAEFFQYAEHAGRQPDSRGPASVINRRYRSHETGICREFTSPSEGT